MDNKVDATTVISILSQKLANVEAQNAVLQAQLEEQTKGDGKDGKQNTKS